MSTETPMGRLWAAQNDCLAWASRECPGEPFDEISIDVSLSDFLALTSFAEQAARALVAVEARDRLKTQAAVEEASRGCGNEGDVATAAALEAIFYGAELVRPALATARTLGLLKGEADGE